jgi:PHO85 cyclin-5
MFLIALIVASKYLQDKNYSLRVWSQKSGLSVGEIRSAEVTFILALDWRLHITNDVFQKWTDTVLDLVSPETAVGDPEVQGHLKWIIRKLKPDLSNAEDFKN